jgi:hypothetical protein
LLRWEIVSQVLTVNAEVLRWEVDCSESKGGHQH